MNDLEEKIMFRLNELLGDKIDVINVRTSATNSQKSIQIMIESEDGVSVDTCASASRMTQNLIKLENIIEDDFAIEVSSPGINRPLFTLKDFMKFQGENTFVELKRNIKNKKRFTGKYRVIDGKITFKNQKETISISIDDIKKANLIREIKI